METYRPKRPISWAGYVSKLAALAALIFGVAILAGCGEPAANNASNKPANSYVNTSSNAPANTAANSTNYAANTSSNSMNSNSVQAPKIVNASVLREALKERLMRDNGALLSQGDWTKDAWLESNVGVFYENDDEIAKTIVCDVTEKTLGRANKKMQGWARQRLFDTVASSTKCRSAITSMLRATVSSVAINPIP